MCQSCARPIVAARITDHLSNGCPPRFVGADLEIATLARPPYVDTVQLSPCPQSRVRQLAIVAPASKPQPVRRCSAQAPGSRGHLVSASCLDACLIDQIIFDQSNMVELIAFQSTEVPVEGARPCLSMQDMA